MASFGDFRLTGLRFLQDTIGFADVEEFSAEIRCVWSAYCYVWMDLLMMVFFKEIGGKVELKISKSVSKDI